MDANVGKVRVEVLKVDSDYARAVSRFDIEVTDDSTGDPAIFVTVVFKDTDLYGAWPKRDAYREKIQDHLFEEWPDRYPYVTFSAESVAIDPEVPALV